MRSEEGSAGQRKISEEAAALAVCYAVLTVDQVHEGLEKWEGTEGEAGRQLNFICQRSAHAPAAEAVRAAVGGAESCWEGLTRREGPHRFRPTRVHEDAGQEVRAEVDFEESSWEGIRGPNRWS